MRLLAPAVLAMGLLTALAGCPEPPQGGPDAGNIHFVDSGPFIPPPDGGFDDAGEAIPVDAGPVNTTVVVQSLNPPAGPMSGLHADGTGVRVVILGEGFTGVDAAGNSTNHVFFGDIEASRVLSIQLPTKISVQVPPCAAPGPVTVRVVNPLGVGELVSGYTCFSPVTVASIDPQSGTTEGGTSVTVQGQGLTPEMILTVGERQVVNLQVAVDGNSATFLTPPGSPGRADVTATDAFGRSDLELSYTYESPLRIDAVTPNVVDDVSAVVELEGSGFFDGAVDPLTSTIGGGAAARDNLISEARLRVVVPSGLSGSQDVAVARGLESALLANALVVRPALTGGFVLTAAVPARADSAGGSVVTLVGEGLTTTTGVTVAGTVTPFVVVDDRTVTLTVPAGAVGPAPIVVTRANATTATLNAFAYFAAVVVDDVSPGAGPAAGGDPVVISGRGFVDPAVVTFGGIPAANVVVVSGVEIDADTPAGAAGPVDVVVQSNGERGVLANGYRFDAPITVVGVRPSRGGVGGDTFVTITGTGFTRGPVTVTFDGTPTFPADVHVVNDSTITCRTPVHPAAGLVDVSVVGAAPPSCALPTDCGAGEACAGADTNGDGIPDNPVCRPTAKDVFTYFDPTSIVGGTRGGTIDGAVYVTALDATLGLPIPKMVAFVGTSDHPIASGITNVFGQATVSGPGVVGPQTVTVMGDCVSSATFVDVDSAELTVYMFPADGVACPPPQPGPPPPPGPNPPIIRGRVFGFAKEFFDPAALDQSGCASGVPPAKCEIAFAEVRTTSRDEFSGTLPTTGANVVTDGEGGAYEINPSRPGRLAVVAVAGIFDLNNGSFKLRQMGVRREVFPQNDVILVDQDITLTIDLDSTIDLSLPDAPMRFNDDPVVIGFEPTITRVVPFIQFGGEGAFNYTQAVEGKRNHSLEEQPDVPGEMLTFISGAYTTDGRNLIANSGAINLVSGEPFITGSGAFDWSNTDLNGNSTIVGKVLVTNRPNGTRFASVVVGCEHTNPTDRACGDSADSGSDITLQLQDAPDFDASGVAYHIGKPGAPSSEVIQDGVGDLRGGVTIQPVLGLPQVLSPTENGVLTDRTLRWKAAPGQQPTIHDMFLFEPFALSTIWEFYVDGSRTKVVIPQIPDLDAIKDSLPGVERFCIENPATAGCGFWGQDPQSPMVGPHDMARGGIAWQHEAIFTPGLDYNNWSLLEIGTRGRRSWTTDVHVLVHGND